MGFSAVSCRASCYVNMSRCELLGPECITVCASRAVIIMALPPRYEVIDLRPTHLFHSTKGDNVAMPWLVKNTEKYLIGSII